MPGTPMCCPLCGATKLATLQQVVIRAETNGVTRDDDDTLTPDYTGVSKVVEDLTEATSRFWCFECHTNYDDFELSTVEEWQANGETGS